MEMTAKKPKVSVCVVTYNQEKYIRQCLQSIVDQATDFDFEVIVGDDCSTDGTSEIVEFFLSKYPLVVRYIRQGKNVGPFRNLMDTCKMAKCEFIAHCDGDDFWLPNKLQTQISFLEGNKNVSGVFTNAVIFGREIGCRNDVLFDISDSLRTIFTKSPFVRSSLVERNFDFNLIEGYYSIGKRFYDFELYWLVHKSGLLMVIGEPYVAYNTESGGIGGGGRILDYYRDAIERLRMHGLSFGVYQAMILDHKIARYLKAPAAGDKPNISEYLKSKDVDFLILSKIFLPIFILKFISFVKRNFLKL